MTKNSNNDAVILARRMCETLAEESVKKVASNAYVNNVSETITLVRAIFQITKNRYFKTILLLWEYKVSAPTGMIILTRIERYCNAGRNKHYIDLCIYKDILGAIKTGNSAFLK